MELIVGYRNKNELQKLESFLSKYILIDLDKKTFEKAVELLGKYRLSHGLLIPDALIASTAIINNFPLLTKN
jgi:predicted nucleic acid-binding protein